ncbi:hypothetical protein HDU93_002318, partial [Gonapodya sp. JEL0774]
MSNPKASRFGGLRSAFRGHQSSEDLLRTPSQQELADMGSRTNLNGPNGAPTMGIDMSKGRTEDGRTYCGGRMNKRQFILLMVAIGFLLLLVIIAVVVAATLASRSNASSSTDPGLNNNNGIVLTTTSTITVEITTTTSTTVAITTTTKSPATTTKSTTTRTTATPKVYPVTTNGMCGVMQSTWSIANCGGTCQQAYGTCGGVFTNYTRSSVRLASTRNATIVGDYSGDWGVSTCKTAGTVAITFEDGPGPYTAKVLDDLKTAGIKATFFVTTNYTDSIYNYNIT